MSSKEKNFLIAVLLVVIIALGSFLFWSEREGASPTPANTSGSTAYELPPQNSWQASTDPSTGITFSYPQNLNTQYLGAVDWPPAFQIITGPYVCTVAGVENAPAGKTQQETINGTRYCVTEEAQGAAGSIYHQYAYAFPKGDKTVVMTFSTREPQCMNYDEPQQAACQAEENSFSANNLADAVAQTIKLPQQ